jgi:small subunit ribosomal protein S14
MLDADTVTTATVNVNIRSEDTNVRRCVKRSDLGTDILVLFVQIYQSLLKYNARRNTNQNSAHVRCAVMTARAIRCNERESRCAITELRTVIFDCLPTATLCSHFTMDKARVLRDIKARHGVKAYEVVRRAYLYVARNQSLPPQVRHQAQLQLNTFGKYTRPTTVKNRCTETGRGRGVMSEFGLCRVCAFLQE